MADQMGFLKQIHEGWLLFAELVGRMNTKIIVTVIYWFLVSLAWFLTSTCLKKKLLDRAFRISGNSAWILRSENQNKVSLEKLRHQF